MSRESNGYDLTLVEPLLCDKAREDVRAVDDVVCEWMIRPGHALIAIQLRESRAKQGLGQTSTVQSEFGEGVLK